MHLKSLLLPSTPTHRSATLIRRKECTENFNVHGDSCSHVCECCCAALLICRLDAYFISQTLLCATTTSRLWDVEVYVCKTFCALTLPLLLNSRFYACQLSCSLLLQLRDAENCICRHCCIQIGLLPWEAWSHVCEHGCALLQLPRETRFYIANVATD